MPEQPTKPDNSRNSIQRWKNIADAIAEDILRDEEEPAISDDVVTRLRERLADLTKAVLVDSGPQPEIKISQGTVIAPVEYKREAPLIHPQRLGDLIYDFCPTCGRTSYGLISSLVNDKPSTARCRICNSDHEYIKATPAKLQGIPEKKFDQTTAEKNFDKTTSEKK